MDKIKEIINKSTQVDPIEMNYYGTERQQDFHSSVVVDNQIIFSILYRAFQGNNGRFYTLYNGNLLHTDLYSMKEAKEKIEEHYNKVRGQFKQTMKL